VTVIFTKEKPSRASFKGVSLEFKPKIINLQVMDGVEACQRLKANTKAGKKVNRMELVFLPFIDGKIPAFEKALKACRLIPLVEKDEQKRKKLGSALMLASNKALDDFEKGELRKEMSMAALIDEDSIAAWGDESEAEVSG
jgi:hypothetical protein